jgi:hypothetical protein
MTIHPRRQIAMNIFRTRPSRRLTNQRVLAVEDGQVLCPRRGVVDIEGCWVCPAYLGMSGEAMDGVVCSTRPVVMPYRMVSRIV